MKIKEKVLKEYKFGTSPQEVAMKVDMATAIDKTLAEVGKVIDDIDLALMFTDIKDKKGNKFEFSNELMEIIAIWWTEQSKKIKQKLGLK